MIIDITIEEQDSGLARAVIARSRLARREATAFQLDESAPADYVADEVVVDAEAISVEGLEPGAYLLHIVAPDAAESPIGLVPMIPPRLR